MDLPDVTPIPEWVSSVNMQNMMQQAIKRRIRIEQIQSRLQLKRQ